MMSKHSRCKNSIYEWNQGPCLLCKDHSNFEPKEIDRGCDNCKYDIDNCIGKVGECYQEDKWEPKETEQITNLKGSSMKEQTYDYRVVGRKDDKIMDKIQAEDGGPLHVDAVSEALAKELIAEKHGTKISAMRKKGYDMEYEIRPFLQG